MIKAVRLLSRILIVLAFSIMIFSCGNSNEPRTSISEHEAKMVAEGQVKTLLKSPSTADFSGLADTKIIPIEDGYKVVGFVDSQNGFGATIRSNYSVEIYFDKEKSEVMYRNLKVE